MEWIEELCQGARQVAGVKDQEIKLVGVCVELSAVLLQYHEGKASLEAVIDNVADVELMIEQLRWNYEALHFGERVEAVKLAKLEGLKEQLEEEERAQQ